MIIIFYIKNELINTNISRIHLFVKEIRNNKDKKGIMWTSDKDVQNKVDICVQKLFKEKTGKEGKLNEWCYYNPNIIDNKESEHNYENEITMEINGETGF